jgi:hippurate hydrolase
VTIDPILEAGHFIVDVQSVVSREKDPAAFGVVTIGAVQSGSVGNIIPNEAQLRGTIRTYDQAVQEKLVAGIKRTAAAVAEMAGAPSPLVEIGRQTAKAVVKMRDIVYSPMMHRLLVIGGSDVQFTLVKANKYDSID